MGYRSHNNSFASVAQSLRQSDNPVLAKARSQYRALAPLESAWKEAVAPPLCQHTQPVVLRDGLLTVHAHSPLWASQLRNLEPSLVRALRDAGLADARALRIRIAPPAAAPAPAAAAHEDDNPEFSRRFEQLRRALDPGG